MIADTAEVTEPQAATSQTIFAPVTEGLDAEIHVYASEGGWRAMARARLPEAGHEGKADLVLAFATRGGAIAAACEELIAWCSEQKEAGGKRHRRQAQLLQDWALGIEKAEGPAVLESAPVEDPGPAGLPALPDGDRRLIHIDELEESAWNPRKEFPAAAMAELTDSMRTSGFRNWLPVLVRPGDRGFEIGAGHRRTRAARAAGITMIPCMVCEMTDAQFLDVLNFDNSGREDVHPLEEAAGWRHWMEQTGKGVLDIAAKIGKSKEYVYQGLKYDALIPEVRQSFIDRAIKPGHAILLARLTPEMQLEALRDACFDWQGNPVSTRTLTHWIQRQVNGADLTQAPFARGDAELVAAAGACEACPKCQGDICMERSCYDGKVLAHIAQQTKAGVLAVSNSYGNDAPAGVLVAQEFSELYDKEDDPDFQDEEEGETAAPEPACSFAEQAIVAHGDDIGKSIRICRNPNCPEHGACLRAHPARTAEGKKDIWAERAAALPAKIKLHARRTVLAQVLKAVPEGRELSHEQLQLIAEALVPNSVPVELIEAFAFPWSTGLGDKNGGVLAGELLTSICAPKGSPAASHLPRILVGLALLETAKEYCFDGSSAAKRLQQTAALLQVDSKVITENVGYNMSEQFKWSRAAAKAKKEGKPLPETPTLRPITEPAGTRREVIKNLPAMAAPAAKKPAPVKKAPAKKAPAAKKAPKPAAKKKGGKK